jgi:hypothetical protein
MIETDLIRTAYDDIEIITRSREDAFPLELRQKRKNKTRFREAVETRPIVSTSLGHVVKSCLILLHQETITCRRCCHDKGYTMEKQVCQALIEYLASRLNIVLHRCEVRMKARLYSLKYKLSLSFTFLLAT